MIGTTTTPDRCASIEASGVRAAVVSLGEGDRLRDVLADRDLVYLTVAPRRRDVGDYRAVYERGMAELLRAAHDTPVRRIVYTSSTRVYGQDDGSWVDERSATEPRDERGRILLAAEQKLQERAEVGGARFDAAIVRLGGIHGPERSLSDRIRATAGSRRADGEAFVNLIHRDDIVEVLYRLGDSGFTGVLNLTDGRPAPRRNLYDRELAAAGLAPIRWENAPSLSRGKRVRSDRVRRELRWTPRRSAR